MTSALNTRTKPRGFTLLELLMVIGAILLLMSILLVTVGALINRAKMAATMSVLQNVETGLQGYYMQFRQFPTDGTNPPNVTPVCAYNMANHGADLLYVYLTYQFVNNKPPNSIDVPSRQIGSTKNCGPFINFNPNMIGTANNCPVLVDGWGTPLHYSLLAFKSIQVDPTDPKLERTVTSYTYNPLVYSFGPNKKDESSTSIDGAGNTVFVLQGDDISLRSTPY